MRKSNYVHAALLSLLCAWAASPAARADEVTPLNTPVASPAAQVSPTASPAFRRAVDPCALLDQTDVAAALGVGVDQLRVPTRPTADECLWAASAHGAAPVGSVVLTAQAAQEAKAGCKGLQCLRIVQTVSAYIPGMSSFNRVVGTAEDVQYITGLGDKAAWSNGRLTVLKQALVFSVSVSAAHSANVLSLSETLARDVLARI